MSYPFFWMKRMYSYTISPSFIKMDYLAFVITLKNAKEVQAKKG